MIYIKQFREALYLNRRRNSNTLDLWDSIFSSCCVESIDLMMYPKALHPPQFTQKRGGIDLSIKHIFFYLFFARFFLYCYWPYGAWLLNFPFISTCHWVFNGSRELEYLFCVLFHRSSFVGIFFFSSTPFSTKCNRLNDVKGLCCCWYSMLYWACQRLFFFSLPI